MAGRAHRATTEGSCLLAGALELTASCMTSQTASSLSRRQAALLALFPPPPVPGITGVEPAFVITLID